MEKACFQYDSKYNRWGINVDVFPLENVTSGRITRLQRRVAVKMDRLVKRKMGFKDKKSIKQQIIDVSLSSIMSVKLLKKCRDFISKLQENNDNSTHFIRMSWHHIDQSLWLKEKLLPVSQVEFEGKMYPAPHNPDYFLKIMYGDDYMQLPPVEKRITHGLVKLSFNTEENT